MKKVLFGLLAISVVSFGAATADAAVSTGTQTTGVTGSATNPGTYTKDLTKIGDSGAAGVPLQVKANVIPASSRLVLVDENNKVIDNLVFDHGNLIPGATSNISQIVELKRTDNNAFSAEDTPDHKGKIGTSTYIAQFAATNAGNTIIPNTANNFALQGATDGATSLQSELDFNGTEIKVSSTATFVRTQVTSKLNVPVGTTQGLYIGNGTFVATLTLSATPTVAK